MSLKNKLKLLKDFFKVEFKAKEDNSEEWDAEFEDHPLGNQNIYRLRYVNYHRYDGGAGAIGVVDYKFTPFMLPDGMKREEAFRILSYLSDYIEKALKLEACSCNSVIELNRVLDLERLGFRRLSLTSQLPSNDVIDLFTVTGRLLLFKQMGDYNKYFEWYSEHVSLAEVKDIYAKYGIEFYDLERVDKGKAKTIGQKLN